MMPPLGNWFSLISLMSIIGVSNPKELIPVKDTLAIPALALSKILKLESVLFSL